MPWSLERFQNTGHLHFITFSCRGRQPFLRDPEARTVFEKALEAMRIRSAADIYGYVVMPEHIHILLSEPQKQPLASAIQGLKQAVSHYLGRGRGAFWEPRYYDFNVFSQRKRVEKLRYIHRNPVRRGLVALPEDWSSSSFRQYATNQHGTVKLFFQK